MCRYVIFAVVAVTAGAAGIVMDVWFLGTAAAWLDGLGAWAMGKSIFATDAQKEAAKHAFDGVSWYWHHPFAVARAWSARPASQLANPGVRMIWMVLNAVVVVILAGGTVWKSSSPKLRRGGADRDRDRDIEKLNFSVVKFDAAKAIRRTPAERVFLGLDDRRRRVEIDWSEMIEHIHILGGSGTGKTSFAVIPICVQAIRRGLAVIVVDFKGDKQAIQILAREAKKVGKRFYLFSLHPGVKSNTYNPLGSGSGSTLAKVERVMTALNLVYDGPAKFYTYSQQAVFLPLLRYFDCRRVKYTLRDIQLVLRNNELVGEMTGEKINPGHIRGLTAALGPYADLDVINDPEPDIDLAQMMTSGDTVYFDLRSSIAPELAAGIGKMIAMDLQTRAASRTQADKVVIVAIDEFQNMACQAMRNIISKVRSANYGLVLSHQAMGDLRAVGEDFANTVVSNTRIKIVFGTEDPGDADYFAKKSGQIVTTSRGWSTGAASEHESEVECDKHAVHTNVFLKLPFGKSVIYRRSQLAVLTNHAHLISAAEKNQMEQLPYPKPEIVAKRGVKTAAQEIERLKRDILARQNQGRDRLRQQSGQVESEEFLM